MIKKNITGGRVKIPEGSACLEEKNEFDDWSKNSHELDGFDLKEKADPVVFTGRGDTEGTLISQIS